MTTITITGARPVERKPWPDAAAEKPENRPQVVIAFGETIGAPDPDPVPVGDWEPPTESQPQGVRFTQRREMSDGSFQSREAIGTGGVVPVGDWLPSPESQPEGVRFIQRREMSDGSFQTREAIGTGPGTFPSGEGVPYVRAGRVVRLLPVKAGDGTLWRP